jgi:hypothetical protein
MIRLWIDELFLTNACLEPTSDTRVILSKEIAKRLHEALGKYIEDDTLPDSILILRNDSSVTLEESLLEEGEEDPNQIYMIKDCYKEF